MPVPTSAEVPTRMKALLTTGDGRFSLRDTDVPQLAPKEILVKVATAAQNPTDWKTVALHQQRGNLIGCDFAGTVVKLGVEVPADLRTLGERVAGVVHGGISHNGAYAEYVAVQAELVIPLPDDFSFEDAATLGIACLTSCQCLYQCLHLPSPLSPTPDAPDLLIWSGTSATGYYAIQLARLVGHRVVSTASLKNAHLVAALGVSPEDVFDYRDSFTARKIFAATEGRLVHAVDCISEGMTPNQVSCALSAEGGTIATLLPYESMKEGVRTEFVLGYSIFGKAVEFPFKYPANPEHFTNAVAYCKLIAELLRKRLIKPIAVKLYDRGLASVAEGFEYMKSGQVHAEKIVYRIADTPGLSS